MVGEDGVDEWRQGVQAQAHLQASRDTPGQRRPAGSPLDQSAPGGAHAPAASAPKLLTPPKLLAVLLALAVAVLFQNFFHASSSTQFLDLSASQKQSSSILVETITTTTTLTQILPVSTESSSQPSKMSASEQTFIAIKPDGVQRGLVGPIIQRFEQRGYKLAAIKLVTPSKEHLETHYADLKEKPFFPGLLSYMMSGPICAMVWEGRDAVKTGRVLLGATNPLASAPGTIRGDFSIDVGRNVCHGSDSVENAKKEIALWFKEGEVLSYKSATFDWVYEKP